MLKLSTPYGDSYTITNEGHILRDDMPGFNCGDSWTLRGICTTSGKYMFIPFAELTKERIASLQLRFKNGSPRFTVCDYDHGTKRVWGNTKWHGIATLEVR